MTNRRSLCCGCSAFLENEQRPLPFLLCFLPLPIVDISTTREQVQTSLSRRNLCVNLSLSLITTNIVVQKKPKRHLISLIDHHQHRKSSRSVRYTQRQSQCSRQPTCPSLQLSPSPRFTPSRTQSRPPQTTASLQISTNATQPTLPSMSARICMSSVKSPSPFHHLLLMFFSNISQ